MGAGKTSVKLIAQPGGTIEIQTGIVDQGGGNLTAVQRVVSAQLGVERERIRLVHKGTDEAGKIPRGGSRGTHIVGNSALNAVGELSAALRARGWNGAAATWPDAVDALARAAATPPVVRQGLRQQLKNTAADDPTISPTAYAVDVSVDAETGVVDIEQVTFVVMQARSSIRSRHKGQVDGGFMTGVRARDDRRTAGRRRTDSQSLARRL